MNGLDIAIVCILGFTLIRGIMTGLMQSVSGIIGAVAGFYSAYLYYPLVSDILAQWFKPGQAVNIVSFFIIFCVVLIAVTLLGKLLKWFMKIVFLGWVDRMGGAVLGLLKGGLVSAVLVAALTTFLSPASPVLKDSKLVPYISGTSETMMELVPEDITKNSFSPNLDELKKVWEKAEEKIGSNGKK
ncbi:MAG: CvpA family protein [Thermodesulfobacteriota bacterium]